jgi:hypothetical protein
VVEINRRFRDSYCRHHQSDEFLMMHSVSTSETSVIFYQTTRLNILEDSHFHTLRLENLISHQVRLSF